MKIGVIDVGLGNIKSVIQAFKSLNNEVHLISSQANLNNMDALILPGVGAFSDGMNRLKQYNLIDPIKSYISKDGFLLGICLGMQLLFEKSYEFYECHGLGLIEGNVISFENKSQTRIRIPHIGWNNVSQFQKEKIFCGIKNNSDFYFVHSYYPVPKHTQNIIGCTKYGDYEFTSIVKNKNIYGFQFHPEKSGPVGIDLLKNFCKIVGDNFE